MTRTTSKLGFHYTDDNTKHIVFPLGGVGSGGFAISGSGRLVDWSIRNRSSLLNFNGITNFAIKVERGDELVDARILQGPYDGRPGGSVGQFKYFDGFGVGANRGSLAGVPHFERTTFTGSFPTAELSFEKEGFPADVKLRAFSPFIPHNDADSSMPAGLFEYTITNTTEETLDFVIAGTLSNHGNGKVSGDHRPETKDGVTSLYMTSIDKNEPLHRQGGVCIATDAEQAEIMPYGYRGQWFDELGAFWRDFAKVGPLPNRVYDQPRATRQMFDQPDFGTVGARVTLRPGESKNLRFVISWFFAHGEIYWAGRANPSAPELPGEKPTWTNFYATRWDSATNVAQDALGRWNDLEEQTLRFRNALFDTTLPSQIKDAASSTLALLRTSTVLRMSGGEFWGWEGTFRDEGSCEGSCTHVWNYQQALPYLFPALERSLRETEFKYNQLPTGGLTFRQSMPLGAPQSTMTPCADGHFGAIIKTYRDWKICGDTEWLAPLWPSIKHAMEFAWSDENHDRWDPEETGILWGRQHHTLDMELYGPNSWLSSMYVAALLACAELAKVMGEAEFAEKCARLAKQGAAFIDEKLFNGSYYQQDIDVTDKSIVENFKEAGAAGVLENGFMEAYWSDEYGQINYQIASGCGVDQVLGQWHAEMCGLDQFLSADHLQSALKAIYDNNYNESLHEHFNPGRVYAYEDEGGLELCTWPDMSTKPGIPAPYSEEIWTGLEYMAASHMIKHGLTKEALDIVGSARQRHDGARRNPYNDMECGSYYARSMSAYALVNAWAGFTCDMIEKTVRFQFDEAEEAQVFWATGTAWGQAHWAGEKLTLTVLHGSLDLKRLEVTLKSSQQVVGFEDEAGLSIAEGTDLQLALKDGKLIALVEEVTHG